MRGGDAVGVARKIEKVVHYGAFWCVACATVPGGPQQVVFDSQPGRLCYGRKGVASGKWNEKLKK